jgi:hypothetical protein
MADRERASGRHGESVMAGRGASSVWEHEGVDLFDS